jgi:threonine aldolase
MRTFRSDNNAGLTPEAMQAIVEANDRGHEIGYGDDSYTQRAIEAFRSVFGPNIEVFFVATGTAANTLAMASLTQPWQQVLCHSHSH